MERDPATLVAMGCRWIAADPERWGRLLDLMEWASAQRPHARLMRGDIYNYAMQRGMDVTLCNEFRRDNSLWSTLSRYAIMCRPMLAEVIRPRDSGIDGVDLVAAWEAIVGDPSCLVLDNWREACRQASPSKAGCPA